MSLLAIVLGSAVILLIAYRIYGSLLARLLKLDDSTVTPAVEMRDGLDYEPIEPKFLLSQHFSAIAAAGPIVGPILAGVMFGWLPALIWILIGSIFIGGVHDFTSLVASARHKARSIAEVVREHMSRRSYILFLVFIWIALVYIIVAFTDLVADSFVGLQKLGGGHEIAGGAVAGASLMYLVLPIIMGLLLRYTRLTVGWATLIFLPLIAAAVWLGPSIPFDVGHVFNISDASAHKTWDVMLLVYCFVASIVPVWLLLQPRGHLGGYFLLVVLLGGMVGVIVGGQKISAQAFIGWSYTNPRGELFPLLPILFITVACGACSGFHSIIASGTTSKQLRRESDAKPVGYGSMLLEAMVAVLALCCVMVMPAESPVFKGGKIDPNVIFAQGIAGFFHAIGVPLSFAFLFVMLAFTTFVYDTLDVCTRLGRYIIQELTGWKGNGGRWFATALTAAVPLGLLLSTPVDDKGQVVQAWRTFWNLFGASNQLLAALALLGVTVWLWRTCRARWVWFVTGLPTVFMYLMSAWALIRFIRDGFTDSHSGAFVMSTNPVPWAALVLMLLAALLLVEAVLVFARRSTSPPTHSRAIPAAA